MKKVYIKPVVKAVEMQPVRPLAFSDSKEGAMWSGPKFSQLSREGESTWDDDEEEDTGGWFK